MLFLKKIDVTIYLSLKFERKVSHLLFYYFQLCVLRIKDPHNNDFGKYDDFDFFYIVEKY